ncbi:fluoride efflux transporter CrcB [bacterium LRH843]|nr:fluoride efflux transporter CrcB [bacterium LRH843]
MLVVGLGGMLGAAFRYVLGKWIMSKTSSLFPFSTWIINISGSFALGMIAVLHAQNLIPDSLWLLMGTGFLGAYTTFSTFGYETIQMLERQEKKNAITYVLTSVLLGILSAWVGGFLARVVA